MYSPARALASIISDARVLLWRTAHRMCLLIESFINVGFLYCTYIFLIPYKTKIISPVMNKREGFADDNNGSYRSL